MGLVFQERVERLKVLENGRNFWVELNYRLGKDPACWGRQITCFMWVKKLVSFRLICEEVHPFQMRDGFEQCLAGQDDGRIALTGTERNFSVIEDAPVRQDAQRHFESKR